MVREIYELEISGVSIVKANFYLQEKFVEDREEGLYGGILFDGYSGNILNELLTLDGR